MEVPDIERLKKSDVNGRFYWLARDLAPLLGYKKWQRFENVILRSQTICQSITRQNISVHFIPTDCFIVGGNGAKLKTKDYRLSQYAVHLVLSLSDVKKPETALLLAHFTLSTLETRPDYAEYIKGLDIVFSKEVTITKEQITIGQIKKAFKHLAMMPQYIVYPYRIDLYFPDYKIAVECDEEGHRKYIVEQEQARQRYLEEKLECSFVRYNPDAIDFNIGDVINQIMVMIY